MDKKEMNPVSMTQLVLKEAGAKVTFETLLAVLELALSYKNN